MTDQLITAEAHLDADWWRQATVYQIYPRSFADTNADGMGDLAGITSRMDYLADLGVDAIWLSPFYPSALADGGYDVADYRNVHPQIGTLEDFDRMVSAAKDRGIKMVVDIVPNHTSDLHEWFQKALVSEPGSPERDRYIFRNGGGPDGTEPPSDWVSHFGGSAWTQVPDGPSISGERSDLQPRRRAGQFYLHLFAREQPDLNWDNPEIRADFLHTLRFWSDRGVDGFRVDVAHALAKDLSEPLRSKPENEGVLPLDGSDPLYDRDEVHEIYREWREVFDSYDPPRTAVAEAWVPAERQMLYARPTELGQAFNFDLLKAGFDAALYRDVITECLTDAAASGASSTWVLSNHDVVRHATRYGLPEGTDLDAWLMTDGQQPAVDVELGLRRARAATLLMLALPGSAYLYQGEELGLPEVADLPASVLQDPIWERTGNTSKGRDGCRVPLPWRVSGESYGFGDGPSWLPMPIAFADSSVEAEAGYEGSTLELYRSALLLRRELQTAESLEWVETGNPEVVHFVRPGGWHTVTNFGSEAVDLPAGEVRVASGPLTGGRLAGETTVWLTA